MLYIFFADSLSEHVQHIWVAPFHPPTPPLPNAHTQPPPSGGQGYEWVAWGRLWQVWVWPDSHFLAPSLLLREEGAEGGRVLPRSEVAGCFMRGTVLGATHQSDVAVNVCDGLVSTETLPYPCKNCYKGCGHQRLRWAGEY